MTEEELDLLRYPVGPYKAPEKISETDVIQWIDLIESFPKSLTKLVVKLSEQELNYKYRPEGWNIRQLIHHCADSHMNSFIRFKLALTEDNPLIKPYFEADWANMADVSMAPFQSSLNIIYGLHQRWVILLKSLSENDLQRSFINPESNKTYSLKEAIGLYAWHCRHHLAHLKMAKITKEKY